MKNTRKMMAFLIGITLLTISPAYADHDRAVTTEQMPRQAQEFIARYFPGEKIAYAKKESDFFEVIYEVMPGPPTSSLSHAANRRAVAAIVKTDNVFFFVFIVSFT